jgi:quercetin dioxygenase-like cupin family protein
MKIMKIAAVPNELVTNPEFTGGKVHRQVFSSADGNLKVITVHFSKGSRNPLHSHSSDQVILVTAGKGIIATEDKENIVEVGDLIIIPAGEKHWQGATNDSDFSHFYVLSSDSKREIIER